MNEAFIIMQIGNTDMDAVCDKALVPAIEAAGLAPRRVDRHNMGDLLKSEIVQFIERSQIIVADLTNERPNCYLEVGYAMGLGKKANLILTAREDHHHDSPNYHRGGAKVHFDLEGYDILFWNPSDIVGFRDELTKRIKRRAAMVRRTTPQDEMLTGEEPWYMALRSRGEAGLTAMKREGYMEVAANITPQLNYQQVQLRDAVRDAQVRTFGWPIGVMLDSRDEYRPRPTTDGIIAEVAIPPGSMTGHTSYDLWKLFRNGRFYTMLSLFEDERRPGTIFWDTRINRVTEALLFLVRLYRRLEASDTDQVTVQLRHKGLASRRLGAANPHRMMGDSITTTEDVIDSRITASLSELEANLSEYVAQAVEPLFMLFDFFESPRQEIDRIVERFIAGEVV